MTHSGDPSPRPPRLRPRWLYRAAYLWAGLGVAWLLVSGRLASYVRAFRAPMQEPPPHPDVLFTTAFLWLVSIGPLLLLAYDLGAQHTQARRLNTSIWRGLRESWRVALACAERQGRMPARSEEHTSELQSRSDL